MVNVFFTVDVEIWPDDWSQAREQFPEAFRRYILGETPKGNFGLPYQLQILSDYDLKGSFFVETLYASSMGIASLSDTTGMITEMKQEVQLHLHPEWLVQMGNSNLLNWGNLSIDQFTSKEERAIVAIGMENLRSVHDKPVNAYRGGNYRINHNLLAALAETGILFDTSYNPCYAHQCPITPNHLESWFFQPLKIAQIYEYPVTVFKDTFQPFRPLQLTACSFWELTNALWQAYTKEWHAIVIVSHSFELLDETRSQPDNFVIRRFVKLCQFLDRHRDKFVTRGFQNCQPHTVANQPPPLESNPLRSILRIGEQMLRRLH